MGSEHREPGLFSTRGRILWTFFFEVFPYVSLNLVLFYPDVPDLDRSGQIVHLIDEDNIYIYNWMIEAFLKSNVPVLGAAQKDRLRVRHFHVVTNDAVLVLVWPQQI